MSDCKWQIIENKKHTLKSAEWVRCIAHIRNNATGEVRRYETEELLESGYDTPSTFSWQMSNYSCDCNRALFFECAAGFKDEAILIRECTVGRFSVNLENPKTGEIYYREY